ncbi:uncharacterized protein LOC116427733 [Nomia melanderi]|uniref:uncharacterized protein LOC116427733 n=1 Tax=Nomia melanderi TaxID=2448451 RepID=UPI003FCE42C0
MAPAETSRACCVCKKLFCCVQCRERHEKTKHTDQQLKCPFCTFQKLPLQSFEDKCLLDHIVITHLPLYCKLCGEIFKQSKDLELFGTCIWWKSQHRHSLVSDYKSILGTPPLTSDGNELSLNSGYNGNFGSLTSPPELYRKTSTPMVNGQKNSIEFKTPIVPNFSLKTPKTNSASLKSQAQSGFQDSTASNYVSFPPSISHKETPFRSMSLNREIKNDLPRSNSRKLDTMEEAEKHSSNICLNDNHGMEDMELTGIEGEVLPDSQSLDVQEKRLDSLKKVRFSDEYEAHTEPSTTSACNMTENEEYFEACDTMSGIQKVLDNSQIQIYEENKKNMQKENYNPDKVNANVNRPSSSSRVVMMVVVENNTNVSTSELIDSGLKKLESITSKSNPSNNNRSSSVCDCSVKTVNSYCSVSSHACYSASNQMISSDRRDSSSSNSSGSSTSSGGLLAAVANAMKSVMRSFSGVDTSGSTETQEVSQREDVSSRPFTTDAFSPMSKFVSSLLPRPGKRTRDSIESPPSSSRQTDLIFSQLESRSPLAKRHRGWYRIKGREPIARMRNSRLTSPRGVSSETQVFHQGSLSVGDTVLPLPSRAHQSTQTEEN